jgi:hypothetical protein
MKKALHMYPLIEAYLSSGLSQQHFCEINAIASSTFHYWLKKYKAENTTPASFIEVNTQAAAPGQHLELTYPNGVKLRVRGADLVFISQLLRLY